MHWTCAIIHSYVKLPKGMFLIYDMYLDVGFVWVLSHIVLVKKNEHDTFECFHLVFELLEATV